MDALILVDVQNDFLPGGALAVPDGDAVIPIINGLSHRFDIVVATQDWHPADHGSFASQHEGRKPGDVIDLYGLPQLLWPDHCVQSSKGAEFAAALDQTAIRKVFPKGTDRTVDSYSGFFDNGHRNATGLGDYLKHQQVDRVFVTGLATDYCVKYTAFDALTLGFDVVMLQDACRGVNLNSDDVDMAIRELRDAGAMIQHSSDAAK